ncbi:hypothetical protein M422DRAFT_276053, partial [Sphaerobolus stellatus SS14]
SLVLLPECKTVAFCVFKEDIALASAVVREKLATNNDQKSKTFDGAQVLLLSHFADEIERLLFTIYNISYIFRPRYRLVSDNDLNEVARFLPITAKFGCGPLREQLEDLIRASLPFEAWTRRMTHQHALRVVAGCQRWLEHPSTNFYSEPFQLYQIMEENHKASIDETLLPWVVYYLFRRVRTEATGVATFAQPIGDIGLLTESDKSSLKIFGRKFDAVIDRDCQSTLKRLASARCPNGQCSSAKRMACFSEQIISWKKWAGHFCSATDPASVKMKKDPCASCQHIITTFYSPTDFFLSQASEIYASLFPEVEHDTQIYGSPNYLYHHPEDDELECYYLYKGKAAQREYCKPVGAERPKPKENRASRESFNILIVIRDCRSIPYHAHLWCIYDFGVTTLHLHTSKKGITKRVFTSNATYFCAFGIIRNAGYTFPADAEATGQTTDVERISEDAEGAADISQDRKRFRYALYLVPTFSNPTGTVLSAVRREKLIKLAAKHHILVICDDVYESLYDASVGGLPPLRLVAVDRAASVKRAISR